MLRLEFPNESHKAMWEEMILTWKQGNYKVSKQSLWLFEFESYEAFLEDVMLSLVWKPGLVPASCFFSIVENRIVGHVSLRHHIEHPNLKEYGGHIGYAIVPWEQGKSYGKEQLRQVLWEAKKIWLERVIISCHEDNIASEKIILSQGGTDMTEIFLNNHPDATQEYIWKILKRHWIEL